MNIHGGNIWDFEGPPLLDYSSNINPFGVPDSFQRALLQHMEEFTRYPDLQYREVKRSVRQYLYAGGAEPGCLGPFLEMGLRKSFIRP